MYQQRISPAKYDPVNVKYIYADGVMHQKKGMPMQV
jgi:hypothetical protein